MKKFIKKVMKNLKRRKKEQNIGSKKLCLIMLVKPKHHLVTHGQNIIQTIQKLEEKFTTDVKKQSYVVLNVVQVSIYYTMQTVIKFLFIRLKMTMIIMKEMFVVL